MLWMYICSKDMAQLIVSSSCVKYGPEATFGYSCRNFHSCMRASVILNVSQNVSEQQKYYTHGLARTKNVNTN